MFRVLIALFLVFGAALKPSWSYGIEEPLRDPRLLLKATSERVVRVTSARVILLDYDLLKKDFPELRSSSPEEIDRWVLKHTAWISKPQAAQTRVNSKIPVSEETGVAYRPADYGRALVFPVGEGKGLIDVKGAGALRPELGDHSNGLASLGEVIREYLYERLVHELFQRTRSPFVTVRNYGVVDLGFDILSSDHPPARAGFVLRQGHARKTGRGSFLEPSQSLQIEKFLRHFGLTSAGAHRNRFSYEWLNIQGTQDGAIVDFGGFLTVDRFEKPLAVFGVLPQNPPLMTRSEVAALQPDPMLRVPLEIWGTGVTGKVDPAFDNPWIWSHELAEGLRNGTASRRDAETHLRNLLGPVEERMGHHPVSWLELGVKDCAATLRGVR